MNKIIELHQKLIGYLAKIEWLILLIVRLVMARVFFFAGRTKFTNFDQTLFLFEYEYAVPLIPVELAAYMATFFELSMPIFLAFGLFTRYASLPLLAMTIVIQSFVYQQFEHAYWIALLLVLIVKGGGKFSLDHLLAKKFLAKD